MVRKFNMYPTTTCAYVIYLHIKRFSHLKKYLTYLNLKIHTNKYCKKLCLSWVKKMFCMWITILATNPPSYNISLIRGNTCVIFSKIFNQWFQSFTNFFILCNSLPLNVHNSFFVGSSNLSHLSMALLRVPLPIFNIFLVFLMSQAFFIWYLLLSM